jgi:hypothetical protein
MVGAPLGAWLVCSASEPPLACPAGAWACTAAASVWRVGSASSSCRSPRPWRRSPREQLEVAGTRPPCFASRHDEHDKIAGTSPCLDCWDTPPALPAAMTSMTRLLGHPPCLDCWDIPPALIAGTCPLPCLETQQSLRGSDAVTLLSPVFSPGPSTSLQCPAVRWCRELRAAASASNEAFYAGGFDPHAVEVPVVPLSEDPVVSGGLGTPSREGAGLASRC